jgi:hypothetical protein
MNKPARVRVILLLRQQDFISHSTLIRFGCLDQFLNEATGPWAKTGVIRVLHRLLALH